MGSIGHIPDFDAPASKVMSPSTLAHVVLRTRDVDKMIEFYTTFLGGKVVYKSGPISFITYDSEHHRIALIAIPDCQDKVRNSCGLEHIAFSFPTIGDLLLAYRQRKAKGIPPSWCVNHGPTTSIYYHDPDGNMLETQVDNFDNNDDATAFMMGPHFAENPIGTDFDPEDYINRLRNGEDEAKLKPRIEMGPRGIPQELM